MLCCIFSFLTASLIDTEVITETEWYCLDVITIVSAFYRGERGRISIVYFIL